MAGKANPCGKMREGNMVSEHTSGPWFSGCHGRDWIQIVADDESMLPLGTTSKLVAHVNTSIGEQRCVANAHLIAAAPAMYEALSQVQAFIKTLVEADVLAYPTKLTDAVKGALAQAEGRQ